MNSQTLALNDDELDQLNELLEKYSAREEGYDIERLDGLFAALAVNPEQVPPSRYLPLIKGIAEDSADNDNADNNENAADGGFATVEEMQLFMMLVMRHSNSVMRELRNPKKKTTDYVPIIFPDDVYETKEDAQKFMGVSWALGFVDGMQLFEDAWDAAVDDSPALEQLEMLITSLLMDDPSLNDEADAGDETVAVGQDATATSDGEELPAWTPLTLDDRLDVLAELPLALKAATLAFAGEHRQARSAQTVVRGEKIGRNEPCPCNSGKKFKQCCGK